MKTSQEQNQSLKDARNLAQNAALESHVRLQAAQEEYLRWLESHEASRDVDAYVYKKIR